MIGRFSLYGFLKNQRYHEPFMVLALREQGLSFLDIGLLVSAGSIALNIFEVPFGAIADIYGRRRCLIIALVAYVAAFGLFGLRPPLWGLYAAMLLYSVGEAFRGGTHKAMIFDWLRAHGRESEAAEIYGRTRSWSKRGSALSAALGAIIVLTGGSFSAAFVWTAIPYVLGIINLAGYPRFLDARHANTGLRAVLRATWASLKTALTLKPLRAMLVESMLFEGSLKICASYLQPLIQLTALSLALQNLSTRSDFDVTVIATSSVYFCLGLIESFASGRAGWFASKSGNEQKAIANLWWSQLVFGSALVAALLANLGALAIGIFLMLYGLGRNLFRTIQLARYDSACPPELAATVLSLESQAQALCVAFVAPIIGAMIDSTGVGRGNPSSLWPCAALIVVGGVWSSAQRHGRRTKE